MSGRRSDCAPDCVRIRDPRYPVDRAIQHAMDGTLKGTEAWFRVAGRKVPTAAHYLIGRDGTIVQMADDDAKLLHAGSPVERGWNDRSVGIEYEVRLTPWKTREWFPLEDWPDAMLRAGALVNVVMAEKFERIHLDRSHIIGHSEVPGATHTDVGPAFPWDRFMNMILDTARRRGVLTAE